MTRRAAAGVVVVALTGAYARQRDENGKRGATPSATPRATAVALALAVAVLTAGCGPERPLELGLKEVPSDLLLGRQSKPAAPLPAILPPTVFFTDPAAPQPTSPTTIPPPVPDPPPPPPPCPTADPLQPARLPVTTEVRRPPAPAAYQYRTAGFIVGLESRTLATTATHTVSNVVPIAPGEFTFDVDVEHEGRTRTTYHVVPRTSTVPAPGLYIQRINDFVPKPELLVVPFPAIRSTIFNSAGTDGVTSIAYEGAVEETERIDVCGTNIDAIRVRLRGRATTGREQEGTFLAEEFDITYLVATQYGGLIVRHSLKASMPGSVDLVARELTGVISREPEDPK